MSNLPIIPVVPNDTPPSLKKFLSSLKELIETREGVRGVHGDQLVTFDDLNSATTTIADDYLLVTDLPENDDTIPDAPTNLQVVKGTWYNYLTWTLPTSTIISHTEIWCSTDSSRSNAERIAIVTYPQDSYDHHIEVLTDNHYYWIRTISFGNVYSTWEPSDAMGGILILGDDSVGETIDKVLDVLLGTTPDAYAAGTTYSEGDLVRYICSDGATRRYKYINGTPASGQTPESNPTYWERIGILMQGDVDGVATVGIDGNLVVDDSIYARHINVNTLSSIKADIGTVTAGILQSYNYSEGSQGVKFDLNNSLLKVYGTGEINIATSGGIVVGNGGDITLEARTIAQGDPGFIKFEVGTDGTFSLGGYSDYNTLTLAIPGSTVAAPKGKFLIGLSPNYTPKPLDYTAIYANAIALVSSIASGYDFTSVDLSEDYLELNHVNASNVSTAIRVGDQIITFSGTIEYGNDTEVSLIPYADDKSKIGTASYRWSEIRGVDLYGSSLNISTITGSPTITSPTVSGVLTLSGSGSDIIPSVNINCDLGTGSYAFGNGYIKELYFTNSHTLDTIDDLEVIESLAAKSQQSSNSLKPIVAQYPDFITNKDYWREKLQKDNGELITKEEVEQLLNDPDDVGGHVMIRGSVYLPLLEGSIRQQYRLFKDLLSRVKKLEGGLNGRIPSS